VFGVRFMSVQDLWPIIFQDLHALLKTTPEGTAVLAFYNLRGKLNDQFRDLLCTRVIHGEIKLNFDKRLVLAKLLCTIYVVF